MTSHSEESRERPWFLHSFRGDSGSARGDCGLEALRDGDLTPWGCWPEGKGEVGEGVLEWEWCEVGEGRFLSLESSFRAAPVFFG